MRILIDTNVFLDFLMNRAPFAEDAERLISFCKEHNHPIFVSAMSMRDIEYRIRHVTHDWKQSRQILQRIYSLVYKILDTSADDAIESIFSDTKDYEGALQIECAERSMVDAIATSNIKDYKKSVVPVFSPRELFDYLQKA